MSDWMFQGIVEFGSQLLDEPKVCGDCFKIYRMFGMQYQAGGPGGDMLFPNARRLVELNNEVWKTTHSIHCMHC